MLKEAWEEVGSYPGAVDAVTAQLSQSGHHLPRTAVASRLKALGLKRGVLTQAQVVITIQHAFVPNCDKIHACCCTDM